MTAGRAAGKDGVASTPSYGSDEVAFYELREYLEQTDADIPRNSTSIRRRMRLGKEMRAA